MRIRLLMLGAGAALSGSGLAACDGNVLWSNPTDGGLPNGESSASPLADAGDGGPLSCAQMAWPSMLAAPIVPLQKIANLNWNQGGPASVTLAYAESVNCPSTPLGAGGYDGGLKAAWGPNNDVSFDYRSEAPQLFSTLSVGGAYSGTLTFQSRQGGAFGNHQYVLGINTLLRDGAPFAIDWMGTSATMLTANAIRSVTELFDGVMATFAPTYPVESDCYASGDCAIIIPDVLPSGSNDGGSPSPATIGFRPLKLYIEMPVGTSTPSSIYAFLTGGPDMLNPRPADSGVVPGTDAGGGVTPPPGCRFLARDLWGSCESPTTPLCGTQPGWVLYSCRDYPQSGFVSTCCPSDGG